MLKKAVCLCLCAVFLALCSCGQAKTEKKNKKSTEKEVSQTESENKWVLEGRLTSLPDYSLNEGASPDEMRQMVVKAMQDELSLNWYPRSEFSYKKVGPASYKDFTFSPDKVYCGMPYTNGSSGLLQWLEYYDFNSGEFDNGQVKDFNSKLGNDCSSSIMWAWAAVLPDITWDACENMTKQNGCIPLGEYNTLGTINYEINSTKKICELNGQQVMFAAYAKLLPADAVVRKTSNFSHAMMINKAAKVVYNQNGEIDGNNSYVYIQDQQAGHPNPAFSRIENGEEHQYSGRFHIKVTFNELYRDTFLPVTSEEFLGLKAYQKATVSFENSKKKPTTYNELTKQKIKSNYNIISVNVTATDKKTKKTAEKKYVNLVGYFDKTGVKTKDKENLNTYSLWNESKSVLADKTFKKNLKKGNTYNIKLDVTVATGQIITVFKGDIKYQ